MFQLIFISVLSLPFLAFWTEDFAVRTVEFVDLQRFMGEWYEIAYLDNSWEESCHRSKTLTYTLKSNGEIEVKNECKMNKDQKKEEISKGIAWVEDPRSNAKWKISFFPFSFFKWLTTTNFWIIILADDYSYAVATDSTGNYLWILSRAKSLPDAVFQEILNKINVAVPKVDTKKIKFIQTKNPID